MGNLLKHPQLKPKESSIKEKNSLCLIRNSKNQAKLVELAVPFINLIY